ncbi:30S ribosomal protein S6 [Tannerella forsythia]|jgi:ribosomal protein S6|nr:30S ribosomal protein S6 [Tannerella forsythia]
MINRRKATKKNFIGKSWIYQENDYLCTANFKTVTFMNNYETVFILTPVLSDAQMKEAVDKIKAVLSAENAEIVNEEDWGLRKLAYPIEKKTTGFYWLIEFKANPETITTLETQFRRDERVIRFLTFRQDKYAAEYAAKRRGLKKASKETEKEN